MKSEVAIVFFFFFCLWAVVAVFLSPWIFSLESKTKKEFLFALAIVLLWPVAMAGVLFWAMFECVRWFYRLPWKGETE